MDGSLAKHPIAGVIHLIMFGYFDLYLLLFIAIESGMKTAQKVNNLINDMKIYIYLKGELIKTRWVIFGDNQFMLRHISQNKSVNTPVSICLVSLAHILNGYDISLNTISYPIFNIQDFRNGL